VYGAIRAKSAGKPKYVLHDGPPYANGHIHYRARAEIKFSKTYREIPDHARFMTPLYVPGGLPRVFSRIEHGLSEGDG